MTASPASRSPAQAIPLMIAAIFCFSVMDACVKVISPATGTLPALWARYAGQMLVVCVLVAPRLSSVARSRYPRLQIARSVLLLMATFFFFLGIARIPLANATAVMALNPVFITLGGAIFLGEVIGPRRALAIAAALCGALLVIRPGSDAFHPAALLPLAAAICFAAYALITRRVGPDEDPWTSLFYTGLVGGVLLSLAAPWFMHWPDAKSALFMIGIALVGTMGQLLLIRALSAAEAGLLAPFSYSGLIFATVIGAVFFAEIPGLGTIAGALVIAGAGLYVWLRETRQS